MEGTGYYVASLDSSGRRITSEGLFARGRGSWVIDSDGFSFLRTLTRDPIRIPRDRIRSVELGRSSWWAGKWLLGARVVEVTWTASDGAAVKSGFVLAGTRDENARAADALGSLVVGAAHKADRADTTPSSR